MTSSMSDNNNTTTQERERAVQKPFTRGYNRMLITAKCGNSEKQVAFPVTPDMEELFYDIADDPERNDFDWEGNTNMLIHIAIVGTMEKF